MLFGASHGVAEASRLRTVIRGRCPHATAKRRRHTRSSTFSIKSHIRPIGRDNSPEGRDLFCRFHHL